MASCAQCGTTILFGGVEDAGLRFCNARCHSSSGIVKAMRNISDEDAQTLAAAIHAGECPVCSGPGPVDFHTSYRVWSILVLTQWQSFPQLSCRPCAARAQTKNLLISAVCGWWGFPFGLVITPIQIICNVGALVAPPKPDQPSANLVRTAKMQLAARASQRA